MDRSEYLNANYSAAERQASVESDKLLLGKTAILNDLQFNRFVEQSEVINGLYQASTLADRQARPYQGANINYQNIKLNEIRPTQYYQIEENIQRLVMIRSFVLSYGQDILNFDDGGVELLIQSNSEIMLPPIVENDSQEGLIILDGTHRSFLARRMGMIAMRFILIDGVSEKFALHKRRLANEWHEVQRFETVLDLKQARAAGFVHRREGLSENQANAYRDFSHLTNRGKDERK